MTALRAAFNLHPVHELGKAISLATVDEVAEWRHRNVARMSLLQDSWPHKNFAFRRFYSAPIHPPHEPMSDERLEQHHAIIREEWREFWTAVLENDIVEILDGGLDLIYTVLDFLIAFGFPPHVIDAAYEEIHASNMTKVDDNGQPVIINGKIQKTPNHTRPDLVEAARKTTPSFDLLPPQ